MLHTLPRMQLLPPLRYTKLLLSVHLSPISNMVICCHVYIYNADFSAAVGPIEEVLHVTDRQPVKGPPDGNEYQNMSNRGTLHVRVDCR